MNSRVLFLLAFLSLVLCLAPSRASAQAVVAPDAAVGGAAPSAGSVPRLIKFSGEINPQVTQITPTKESESAKDQSAMPVTLSFSLYELQEGGSPLWSESQRVQLDDQGRYSVLLGATQPDGLPLDLFTSGKALWLGVQPQSPGTVEQPRVLLVAVPYALKASDSDTLGGRPASAYALTGSQALLAADGSRSSPGSTEAHAADQTAGGGGSDPQPLTTCSTVTADGNAAANQVALYSAACALKEDANFVDVSGKVGIGLTNPSYPLQVVGTFGTLPSNQYGVNVTSNWTLSASDPNYALIGMQSEVTLASSSSYSSTNPLGLRGVEGYIYNSGSSAATGAAAMVGLVRNYGGTITNAYGFYLYPPTASGPITNSYGAYIGGQKVSGVNTGYGIYAAGAGDINYFAGSVGIETATPASGFVLEVNGTAKFDNSITFASGQTFPIPNSGVTNAMLQYPSLTINTQGGSGLTGGGVVALGNALALSVDPTVIPTLAASNTFSGGTNTNTFSGNVTTVGNLFVGSGNSSSLPLEVRAGGSLPTNDALTVDSQGNVAVGAGTGSHITTASADSDFAGSVSIPSGQNTTLLQPSVGFVTYFTSGVPACIVTPYVGSGNTPTIPSWYIVYSTNGNQVLGFSVYLTANNPNTYALTFNYICVGNPN